MLRDLGAEIAELKKHKSHNSTVDIGKDAKMLVLTRGKDESIVVGENVQVTIVDIRGNKVRLGITAPKSITVHRREVYEAIRRAKTVKHD